MESSEAVARDSLSAVEEVLNRTLEADIAALRVRGGHVYTAPLVRDGMNRGMQKSHEATLALERHKVEASHRVRVGDLNKFFDGQLVRVSSTYSRFRAELLPSYCPSAGGCNRRRSPHV